MADALTALEQDLLARDADNAPVDWDVAPTELRELVVRYYPSGLPSLTVKQAREVLDRLATPGAMMRKALPLVCVGAGKDGEPACPYTPGCPLVDAGLPPLGQPCPFETANVDSWFTAYMRDLEVLPTNLVELSQVKDLIAIDLLMQRATGMLSRDGLIDENPVGVIPDKVGGGITVYRKDPAVAASLLERFATLKQRVLKAMVATREAKARFKKDGQKDPSTLYGDLLRKAGLLPV